MALGSVSLARQRASLWLSDLCDITDTGTVTDTPSGGTDISGATTTENVPCRFGPASADAVARIFGDQLVSRAVHTVAFLPDATIDTGWTITFSGMVYPVIAVERLGTGGVFRHVLVSEGRAIGG